MRRLALFGSLAWLAGGCGSVGGEPAVAVQGEALTQRAPFTAHGSAFEYYADGIRSLVLVLSDTPTTCEDMRAHRNPAGSQRLVLTLRNTAWNIPMTTQYLVYAGKGGHAYWGQPSVEGHLDVLDAACHYSQHAFVDGYLTLESLDSGSASAVVNYRLMLGDKSVLQGRWQVNHCSGINTLASTQRADWACEPSL